MTDADLRHTFATMALQNKIDIKTISDILGHSTVATTINTYLHVTEQMQRSAADSIDRRFAKRSRSAGVTSPVAPIVATEQSGQASDHPTAQTATVAKFEPYRGKKRKPGTGYIKQLSPNCWQGRYTPTIDGKRVAKNVYGKTREECEEKLSDLIKEIKKQKMVLRR